MIASITTLDLLFLFGIITGVLSGLLGVGGGIIFVPLLIGFGFSPIVAIGTSSLAIVLISFTGSAQNLLRATLPIRVVIPVALGSLLGAPFGALLVHQFMTPRSTTLLFGVFVTINLMLLRLRRKLSKETAGIPHKPENVNVNGMKNYIQRVAGVGLSGGFFSGFFGVGGGVILVPLLVLIEKIPLREAVKISLLVVLIGSIASATTHVMQGSVVFREALMLGLGGVIGTIPGTWLVKKLPEKYLQFSFQTMLVLIALFMFAKGTFGKW